MILILPVTRNLNTFILTPQDMFCFDLSNMLSSRKLLKSINQVARSGCCDEEVRSSGGGYTTTSTKREERRDGDEVICCGGYTTSSYVDEARRSVDGEEDGNQREKQQCG
ncbi:hypothetical protein Q3G72_007676 [Acer saccharum]|nr:hypothetical protein Q3G72_007676 [Acer saccharum]